MLEHSRALRLGEGVTGMQSSELHRLLDDGHVAVSFNHDYPGALLAVRILLTTLRRLPGEISLVTDVPGAASTELLAESVAAIDPDRGLLVRPARHTHGLRVHVGPGGSRDAIRITPEGYGVHLTTGTSGDPSITAPVHPLGAIYTAAVGAAEVFKTSARVLPWRQTRHRALHFCPVSLSSNLTATPVAPRLHLNLALLGLGAVGTGNALILSELDADGTILAVDRQNYAPENRGTYSLGGHREAREQTQKVDVAARILEQRYTVRRYPHAIADLISDVDAGNIACPSLLLTGLDSVEARHEGQRLWPDHIIDAATGDTMLGIHDVSYGKGPCLMCFLEGPRDTLSSATHLANQTGLSIEVTRHGDTALDEGHLSSLSQQQQERLRPHLGKPVCGLARALGLSQVAGGDYRPAVPFVALQAACLAVGRLLRLHSSLRRGPNFVQYDALLGPSRTIKEQRRPTPGCYCQTRTNTIEQVRVARGSAEHNT